MSTMHESSTVYTVIETITPAIAERLLATNMVGNRNISAAVVSDYARNMRNNKFKFNGETIKISSDGTLIDGQHRLRACVQSQTSFQSLVVRGLASDSYKTIDTGRRRKAMDSLVADGITSARRIASAAPLIISVQKNFKFKRSGAHLKLNGEGVTEFFHNNPSIQKSAAIGGNHSFRFMTNEGVITAMHFLFSKSSEASADLFFDMLASGSSMYYGHPILTLRERLIRDKASKERSAPIVDVLAWFIRSWNSYYLNQNLTILKKTINTKSDLVLPLII